MFTYKNKNLKFFIFFFIILIIFFYFFISQFQKKKKDIVINPISINLLTSVHPNLPWDFKPVNSKVFIKPGEVTTIEYIVENLGDANTTGIATFAYFPRQFESYISKINCFCYDAQTLKAKQKDKFMLVLLIDPEVTKDSKTINIKEAIMQFTFFDYDEFKKGKT